ncbi:unnamed protein product, partial [Allacma fusca]
NIYDIWGKYFIFTVAREVQEFMHKKTNVYMQTVSTELSGLISHQSLTVVGVDVSVCVDNGFKADGSSIFDFMLICGHGLLLLVHWRRNSCRRRPCECFIAAGMSCVRSEPNARKGNPRRCTRYSSCRAIGAVWKELRYCRCNRGYVIVDRTCVPMDSSVVKTAATMKKVEDMFTTTTTARSTPTTTSIKMLPALLSADSASCVKEIACFSLVIISLFF